MELKNAVAVCVISLFSATLVVLIARTLDSQSAASLEPHLIRIAEELQAIRKQGGLPVAAGDAKPDAAGDGLVVYYFHGNTRCPTCQSIESQAQNTVQTDFAPQLASGEIVWKILNYEQPAAATLKKRFDVQVPVVVLARTQGGEIRDWKRLDEVWALESDKPGFRKFMREQIQAMLGSKEAAATPKADALDIPVPEASVPAPNVPPMPKLESPKNDDSKKVSELPIP